jgi:hypothetical protein
MLRPYKVIYLQRAIRLPVFGVVEPEVGADALLLETGDYLLLESGDHLLVEGASSQSQLGSAPSISLHLASRLGVGADANNTIHDAPFYIVDLTGTNASTGETVQCRIDGANDAAYVLTSADITRGFAEVQLDPQIRGATVNVDARIEGTGTNTAFSTAVALTVGKFPLDDLDNVYAAGGTQKLKSDYAGDAIRLVRSVDSAVRDFGFMADGFVSMSQVSGWSTGTGAKTEKVSIVYDQSGNSRNALQTTAGNRPLFTYTYARGSLGFDGGTSRRFMEWGSAVGFARNRAAVSLIASIKYDAIGTETGQVAYVGFVSKNAADNTRAAFGTGTGSGGATNRFVAAGRRLDADSTVATVGIAGSTAAWVVQCARFSYSEAKLFHRVGATSETVNPFQTAGSTSDTDSTDAPRFGRFTATGGAFSGAMMSEALVADKLTDVEDTGLTSSQLAFASHAETPYLVVGATKSAAAARAEIIDEIFSGAGLPTEGVEPNGTITLDITDPLVILGVDSPNRARVDYYELEISDTGVAPYGTTEFWIFRPTVSVNKLAFVLLGHNTTINSPPDGISLNTGRMARDLISAGYTVALGMMGPSKDGPENDVSDHNDLPYPTATYNPLRNFVQGPVRVLNELIGEGFEAVGAVGQSGGGWLVTLFGAVDTRVNAVASHAGWLPLYMKNNLDGATTHSRDFEQFLPGLWELGYDYPDLAVLCCADGRELQQSLNDEDPAIGDQASHDAYVAYEDHVTAVAALYDGTFSLTYDDNNLHSYLDTRRAATITLFDGMVPDVTAPQIIDLDPADNATNVPITSDCVMTFHENLVAGAAASFRLTRTGTGQIEELDETHFGTKLVISGATLTINWTNNLVAGGNYEIQWDAGSLKDAAGNAIAASSGATQWNFSTDSTAPTFTTATSGNQVEELPLAFTVTTDEVTTKTIVGGPDQAEFEFVTGSTLALSHTLRFASNGVKDFEAPTDTGAHNDYIVDVRATDGSGNTTDQRITITVTDAPAIVFEWEDPATQDPPLFDVTFPDLLEDDVVQLQRAAAGTSFAAPTTTSHTVTGSDIIAGTLIDFGAGTYASLGSGSFDGRIRRVRDGNASDYSGTDTVTVSDTDDILLEIGDHLLL